MADFPTTSLQSALIGEGLNPNAPQDTYTTFAEQMARNQQQQAAQEEALARAKELTTQAGITTSQEQEAQSAGYNPQLINTMTPDAAVTYLNIILKEKGISIDPADIAAWKATLPPVIDRQEVEAFASRFARETTRSGQPANFTTDQDILIPTGKTAKDIGLVEDDKDPTIGHVPNDGMYQVVYDNQGQIMKFIPGGKEPVDQTAKINAKMGESTEKQWQKLDQAINQFLKSTRGNQITTSIYRADRALNELSSSDVLTPQVLSYIQKDLSGIFQGGVPPQAGMEGEDFTTTYQKVNAFIQKYTGISGYLHTDLGNQRSYLLALLTRLWESSVNILKSLISSEQSGYKGIIDQDPDRWATMIADKTNAATSGLSATAQSQVETNKMPSTVTPIPGVQTAQPAAPATGAKQDRLNLGL